MPTIAPWIIPPNYAQIMEAGAQTGLAVRRQAEQEAEAGDRLRMAYDTLASQERRASEAAQARREQAMAAMQLRASQSRSLDAYRAGQLNARQEMAQQQAANAIRQAEEFQQREAGIESRFTRTQEAKEKAVKADLEPPTAVELPGQPGYFATKSATGKGYTIHPKRPSLEEVKQLTPQAASALATRLPELAGTFGTNWVNEVTPIIQKRISEGLASKSLKTNVPPSAGTTEMPKVATKADFDALAPGTLYTGKDGKTYRKP